uniref:MIP08329p n=1 Tax=Drosophila melanogaster TaxID=7227 RepID=C8VV86_DROME|nr:MIP08329p [Drosophila melanogaster]
MLASSFSTLSFCLATPVQGSVLQSSFNGVFSLLFTQPELSSTYRLTRWLAASLAQFKLSFRIPSLYTASSWLARVSAAQLMTMSQARPVVGCGAKAALHEAAFIRFALQNSTRSLSKTRVCSSFSHAICGGVLSASRISCASSLSSR